MNKQFSGLLHKSSGNRFQIKGSPYLFIWTNASDKQLNLLNKYHDTSITAIVTLDKFIGNIALVKHVQLDFFKSKTKSVTRRIKATNETASLLIEHQANKHNWHTKGFASNGVQPPTKSKGKGLRTGGKYEI